MALSQFPPWPTTPLANLVCNNMEVQKWHNWSKLCKTEQECPDGRNKESVYRGISWDPLWQSRVRRVSLHTSTITTAIKKEWVNCNMGPNHVPTRGSLVYGFCNSWSQDSGKSEEGDSNHPLDMGSMMTGMGVTTPGPWGMVSYMTSWTATTGLMKKVSTMPVGDISKVKGWESTLWRLGPSLQYLTDCTLPPTQQSHSYLSNFMILNPKCTVITLQSRCIIKVDDQSNKKWNGVSGNLSSS